MFENPTLGYLGLGMTALGGVLGFAESKSAEKKLDRMYANAISEMRQGQTRQRAANAAAQAQNRAAQAQAREGTKAAERRLTAGEQRAQTLANMRSRQMQDQRTQTAFGRGQMGTTLGSLASQGMLRNLGLMGLDVAAQGAGQRAQLQQMLGGQLAQLSGQSGQMYMQQGQMEAQNAAQLAQLMGSYQPIVNTGLSSMLGTLGGTMFGMGLGKDFFLDGGNTTIINTGTV